MPTSALSHILIMSAALTNMIKCNAFIINRSSIIFSTQIKELLPAALQSSTINNGDGEKSDHEETTTLWSSSHTEATTRRKVLSTMITATTSILISNQASPAIAFSSSSAAAPKPPPEIDPTLSAVVQRLWNLDTPNRLVPGKDYIINVQNGKSVYVKDDVAPQKLFVDVDPKVFTERSTYKAFVALLNNYSAKTGTAEDISRNERDEINTFLTSILSTPPMQFCYSYCKMMVPDKVPDTQEGFMELLYKIWFQMYRRGKDIEMADSSGFEHVFVGEVSNDGKVIGFHNWIQFYLEEQKGNIDYRGYIKPKRPKDGNLPQNIILPDADDRVLTTQFIWNGAEKLVGTTFIGVSPEFEMAFFTTIFLLGKQDNFVRLNTGTDRFDLDAKCFRIAKGKVGSCFVESLAHE